MQVADIKSVITKVTKRWTKQRKREMRNNRAAQSREAAFNRSSRRTVAEVVWMFLPQVYAIVSDNGRLPASARQLFYRIRVLANKLLGHLKDGLNYQQFSQRILPQLIAEYPDATTDWWIVYDPRGQLREPFTDTTVRLGTLAVAKYLRDIANHETADIDDEPPEFELTFPTCGPKVRFAGILFIEKEGFNELFQAVQLAERYDLAIMSCKGQSVVSARVLVDHLCAVSAAWSCPVYILHDFDAYGLSIAQTLTEVTEAARAGKRVRYEFQNEIDVIDVGLRLADVAAWKLQPERCQFKGDFGPDSIATEEEQAFLRSGRRVELNAFASSDFIEWIESKLQEHGVEKVIPDPDTLAQAYRRALCREMLNAKVREVFDPIRQDAATAIVPDDLEDQIRAAFDEDRAKPWDEVIGAIVREKVKTEANDNDERAC
jgi:hypothetical protein